MLKIVYERPALLFWVNENVFPHERGQAFLHVHVHDHVRDLFFLLFWLHESVRGHVNDHHHVNVRDHGRVHVHDHDRGHDLVLNEEHPSL